MSAKSILEADGKAILNYHLTRAPVIKPTPLPPSATHNPAPRLASLHFPADAAVKDVLDQAEVTYPWLLAKDSKFVAKPDQLIKRRGKSGLLALNKTWPEAREWIEARAGKAQKVETVEGVLRQFLVEPFVPHPQNTEYYININSVREVCRDVHFCIFFELQLFPFRLRKTDNYLLYWLEKQCCEVLEAGVRQASRRREFTRVLFPTGSGRAKGKVTQTHRRAHTCSHPDMSRAFHCLLSIIDPFCLLQIAFVP